uniref:G-protein coupled receptors family 1 profile domain-containing protein n=1 Tax=Nannospalax galili TaxID=1026970 RepID=A0A8C6RRP8_NANGA
APSRTVPGGEHHTSPEIQFMLFSIFLRIYLVTLIWNLGLTILIGMDSHLQTPMHFFLRFLSFINICYSSSIKNLSFIACATQHFVLAWMAISECCLLAIMAYGTYVAIGNPLQYSAIMAPSLCQRMVAGVYGTGFLGSLVQTTACFNLYYCRPNIIQHFFCDLPQVISLSFTDTFISQLIHFLEAVFVGFGSFFVTPLSYVFIAVSILKISSFTGCVKAFKTCGSHLATDKALSAMYAIFIPMLNSLIYSLRNTDIKEAFNRVMKRAAHLPQRK